MAQSPSETKSPDEELERALRGESRALLGFIVMLVGDLTVADDCFQETCLEAWRNRTRFDRSRDLGRWLRGIARNVVRRTLGQRRPLALSEEHELALVTTWSAIEAESAAADRAAALRRCLDELDEGQRSLVALRYDDHCPHETIARQLGRTTAAVKMKISRLRRRLQECVRRRLDTD